MQELLPGTQVIARQIHWEVVFSQSLGEQRLYRLRAIEGALRGREFDLLSPFEKIEPVITKLDPARAAKLQHWRVYHQAFLLEQALGPTAILAAQPGRLKIAPYQLVPLMRALRMSRPRLLLADGVGLGKTIEAGLILAELIARRLAHRILIVSPAGPLLRQWQTEMRDRFGLRFTVLDREKLQEIKYQQELGSNPFDYEALGLISIDFAKQEKVLQELERTHYDVVVIDEAHHCMKLGNIGDNDDSLRRRLAEVLARQTDNLLLLTATPHDGYDPHFASLMELLDPSLVDGKGSLRGDFYRNHIVRRLKRHIKNRDTGEPLFKERRVYPIKVNFNKGTHPNFSLFQEGLLALIVPQLRRAIRKHQYGDVLAFISLLKRSVSTIAACKNTLEVIEKRLAEMETRGLENQESRKQRLRTLKDYRRRLEKFGVLSFEEEQDQANLEAEDMAAELAENSYEDLFSQLNEKEREVRREREKLNRLKEIRQNLSELIKLADKALVEDPKLTMILTEIQAIKSDKPNASIIIYTEYTDSQDNVVNFLKYPINANKLNSEILVISGKDDEAKRTAITARFSEEDNLILVSTDATAEGLNLHSKCHHLIHLELPYNPNRLEQRNGRIDRFGQQHEPQIRYLYLVGTFEERLLLRLVAKYEKQRTRLSFVPNTLGITANENSSVTVKLLEGLAEEQQDLFKNSESSFEFTDIEQEDTSSTAYREMLSEVEKAFKGFEQAAKTNTWLGEEGLNANEQLLEEAAKAKSDSNNLGVVDLLSFVTNAIRADSTDPKSVSKNPNGIIELKLNSNWTYGLTDIPGYNSQKATLRLTTNIDQILDENGESVGYLGRAHPVVRKALDRVRNIQFGANGSQLDRRISAVETDSLEPEILFTFLGRVQSAIGREFERVLAVKLSKSNHIEVMPNYSDWEQLADLSKALPTAKQWDKHFKDWAENKQEELLPKAKEAFEALADTFIKQHVANLNNENNSLLQWLKVRTEELCGKTEKIQLGLFDNTIISSPKWQTLEDDFERLTAFATDGDVPTRSRREAEVVLKLFKHRSLEIEKRRQIEEPNITLLGMLMLVPKEQN